MIKAIFRSEFFRASTSFLMIFMVTFLYIFASSENSLNFFPYEKEYSGNRSPEDFCVQLASDSWDAAAKVYSIRNLEGFRDINEGSEDSDNIWGDLKEDTKYSSADYLWIKVELAKKGAFTDTVNNDYLFLLEMEKTYSTLNAYPDYVKELIRADEKMLNRNSTSDYDKTVCAYESELLKKIPLSRSNTEPISGINAYTEMFGGDFIFSFFAALLCYRMYTAHRKTGYINYIKTLKCGLKKFTVYQLSAHLIMLTAAYLLYCLLYLVLMARYMGSFSVFSEPVQILKQMQFSVYPITVGEYTAILLAGKYLFYLMLSCFFALVSMLSPHDLVSLAVCGLTAVLPFILKLTGAEGVFADGISGNITAFIDRSDITVILGKALPACTVVLSVYFLGAVLFFASAIIAGQLQFRTVRGKAVSYA